MSPEAAQTLALQVLTWMIGEPDVLNPFLSESGAAIEDLRTLATSDAGLLAIVDHVMQGDARVLTAAEAIGVRPETIGQARQVLAGPAARHWT